MDDIDSLDMAEQEKELKGKRFSDLLKKINGTDLEYREKAAQVKKVENENKYRDILVPWVKNLSLWYLIVVLYILVFNSIVPDMYFHVSDEIILAILGTTTANVLGLAHIVLKGLFKANE